jgi:hypothetical protein
MLKHAGLLEPQDPGVMPFDETVDLELRWKEWLRREHNNRYTKSPFPTHSGRARVIHRIYTVLSQAPESRLIRTYLNLLPLHLLSVYARISANPSLG